MQNCFNNVYMWYSDGLQAGRPGHDSRERQEISLFSTASRPALGPTKPPVRLVSGTLSPEVKEPGRESDHSPPSSAEVNKDEGIPPLSQSSS
jgi:hypothetical protein